MNLRQAKRHGMWKFVTLVPKPIRIDWQGNWWPPIDYLWQVEAVRDGQIHIRNVSTHHCVALDSKLFKQYNAPREDAPPNVHGHFELRSAIVLSGAHAFPSYSAYEEVLDTRPQILMPVSGWAN